MSVRLSGATALALLFSMQSAAALTPEEAWTAWQQQAAAGGSTVTAAGTVRNGDTLRITGISASYDVPEGPEFTLTFPEVSFRDRGDNTVEVTYPAAGAVRISNLDGDDDTPTIVLDMIQQDAVVIASGTVQAPVYDYSAKTVTVSVKEVTDQDGKAVDVTGSLVLSGMSGRYAGTTAESGMTYEATSKADSVTLQLRGHNPVVEQSFALDLSIDDLEAVGQAALAGTELMQGGDVAAALAAGFMIDNTVSTGALDLKLNVMDQGQPSHAEAVLSGALGKVLMNADRMEYQFGMTGGSVNINGFDMPLPEVSGSFAEMGYGFGMPLGVGGEPQDFSLLVRMVDFSMSEDLWNLFDPGAALGRDPVTLILDLGGKGNWLVDIFDPEAQMDGPEAPMTLASLTINEALARAAGAQVAADGALTFDQTDLDSYGGFPAPEGTITVTMDGINALLDALVAIGAVPEDEMTAMRFALASVTKPGVGNEQLVSEIEFREGGSILVNGMRMK